MAIGNSDPVCRLADALRDVGDRLHEISDELRGLQLGATTISEPPTPWQRLSRVTPAAVVLVPAIQRGHLGPLPRLLHGAGRGAALAASTGASALTVPGIAVLCLQVVTATGLVLLLRWSSWWRPAGSTQLASNRMQL